MLYCCYYFNYYFFTFDFFRVRMCVPYVEVATPITFKQYNIVIAKLSFDTPQNVLD